MGRNMKYKHMTDECLFEILMSGTEEEQKEASEELQKRQFWG